MLGLYCAVVKKNMVKIVIGIMIMEYAANLFLVMLGFRGINSIAPIIERPQSDQVLQQVVDGFVTNAVDPLPQALVLTSIVICLGSLALMISICIRTYEKYGTFDITQIRRLKG
jgi:multicomponent Na+:H+ antiporter subunit C